MNTPHKHAEVIKAWADGAKIEFREPKLEHANWEYITTPKWHNELEYRVKPEPKKYKVDVWLVLREDGSLAHLGSIRPKPSPLGYHLICHTIEGEL